MKAILRNSNRDQIHVEVAKVAELIAHARNGYWIEILEVNPDQEAYEISQEISKSSILRGSVVIRGVGKLAARALFDELDDAGVIRYEEYDSEVDHSSISVEQIQSG